MYLAIAVSTTEILPQDGSSTNVKDLIKPHFANQLLKDPHPLWHGSKQSLNTPFFDAPVGSHYVVPLSDQPNGYNHIASPVAVDVPRRIKAHDLATVTLSRNSYDLPARKDVQQIHIPTTVGRRTVEVHDPNRPVMREIRKVNSPLYHEAVVPQDFRLGNFDVGDIPLTPHANLAALSRFKEKSNLRKHHKKSHAHKTHAHKAHAQHKTHAHKAHTHRSKRHHRANKEENPVKLLQGKVDAGKFDKEKGQLSALAAEQRAQNLHAQFTNHPEDPSKMILPVVTENSNEYPQIRQHKDNVNLVVDPRFETTVTARAQATPQHLFVKNN